METKDYPHDPAPFPPPRLIAWEVTRRCNLRCVHCRADAEEEEYAGELRTAECLHLVDEMAEMGRPILILTGGEPLTRPDLFDIACRATARGLTVVMGTNGTIITPDIARDMRDAGIGRISVSLDFPTPELHDTFRGVAGAFDATVEGIRRAQAAGIEVQINTTITRRNVSYLEDMLKLALNLGAVAFHPFLLVPTGRGKALEAEELSPADYERTLQWIYRRQQSLGDRIFFKPTDAPHYMRVMRQHGQSQALHPHQAHRGEDGKGHASAYNTLSRGCLAGTGFMFISHVGDVQGCGYLTVKAGNVRDQPLAEIWQQSRLFQDLRDTHKLKGKCGRCEYKSVCGGCRARAYEATGDYLAEEPYCVYKPRAEHCSEGIAL